jgi:hypothetical protein
LVLLGQRQKTTTPQQKRNVKKFKNIAKQLEKYAINRYI